MNIDWQGEAMSCDMLSLGAVFFYADFKQTHLAIRADDQARPGTKLHIALTRGYDHTPSSNGPACFDLSILSARTAVYQLPAATVSIPTDRKDIHPGRYGIEDPRPGALLLASGRLFLAAAYNGGVRFLDLTDGIVLKEWPLIDDGVWFSSWRIIWQRKDESRELFRFPPVKTSMP